MVEVKKVIGIGIGIDIADGFEETRSIGDAGWVMEEASWRSCLVDGLWSLLLFVGSDWRWCGNKIAGICPRLFKCT